MRNITTKYILIASFNLILLGIVFPQTGTKKPIKDGLYLIDRIDSIHTSSNSISSGEIVIGFSAMFAEFNSDNIKRIIIDTTAWVPLELEKPPVAEQQTELKKKLLLSLTKEASEQLKTFTGNHIMRMVALVVDGEALTMHKIREAITSGQLQISRCNDNACEQLLVKLRDNVKQ